MKIKSNTICAILAATLMLAACQTAPNDDIPVPTTANTNAVNTVAAASATAKAAPTATQPAPTATPPPTATTAPSPTPSPAPTTAAGVGGAPPWAGKLKRIPGATDPDGFVYEVTPEAMAGIEDWLRRFQEFADSSVSSPETQSNLSRNDMEIVVTDPQLTDDLAARKTAKTIWLQPVSTSITKVIGAAVGGEAVKLVYSITPLATAKEYDRINLKLLQTRQFLPSQRVVVLKYERADGRWRLSKDIGKLLK